MMINLENFKMIILSVVSSGVNCSPRSDGVNCSTCQEMIKIYPFEKSGYYECRDKEEVLGNMRHEGVREILEGDGYGKYKDQYGYRK